MCVMNERKLDTKIIVHATWLMLAVALDLGRQSRQQNAELQDKCKHVAPRTDNQLDTEAAATRRSEREMSESVHCLVVSGDNHVTDRLYTAIASGCLPVVVADEVQGAFSSAVAYDRFWTRRQQRKETRAA